jgi:hypothetical protein
MTDPVAVEYLEAVEHTRLMTQLRDHRVEFEWTVAQVVHDDPAKTLDANARSDVLLRVHRYSSQAGCGSASTPRSVAAGH